LAERGVSVSDATIRAWCARFGPSYAARLRRRRARPGDKWHLDEVLLKIKGERHRLWRAVDQHGVALDILVHGRRDQVAAARVGTTGGDHRQAGELAARTRPSPGERGPPSAQRLEQPGREFTPADTPAGAADAALQAGRPSPALPRAVRGGGRPRPKGPLPHACGGPAPAPGGPAPDLARGRRAAGCLTRHPGVPATPRAPNERDPLNLTVPWAELCRAAATAPAWTSRQMARR
jgi:DDE domain